MKLTEEQEEQLLNCKDCNINTFSLKGKEFNCKIVNVYDADTCRAVFFFNDELVKYTIRLKGVDSPEIRPPSKDKYRHYQIIAAKKSRNRLIQLSTDCNLEIESELSKSKIQKLINDNKKIIKIKCEEFDKYGRLLGSLYNNDYELCNNTESINKQLIKEGYAYEYDGGTKTKFNYDKYIKEEKNTSVETL
jgi:endonuclease YncB( thermonuclease family)